MYKQESEKVSSGRDASKSPRAPAGTGGRLGVPAYKGAPQERDQPLQGIGALASVGRETQRRRQSRNLTWDLWMRLGCCAPPQNHGQNVVCPATLRGGNGAASPPWLVSGFHPEVPKLSACGLQPAASRGRSAQGCEKQSPGLAAAQGWASRGLRGSGFSPPRCPPARG